MALSALVPVLEIATAMAGALEELLGDDIGLVPGEVVLGDPREQVLPVAGARTVVLPFNDGLVGEVALVVDERLAAAMTAATSDVSLVTAALPALSVGAAAIGLVTDIAVDVDDTVEIATDTLTGVAGDFAAVPLFDRDGQVACVVVRVVEEAAPQSAVEIAPPVEHEFPTLDAPAGAVASSRPLSDLNDVAMEVTAELGRRRLKVRDIAALQPGSVLALDRAAGSPVDLRVNGTLVLRGEVVVMDEDLGVRVTEVVVDEPSSAAKPR